MDVREVVRGILLLTAGYEPTAEELDELAAAYQDNERMSERFNRSGLPEGLPVSLVRPAWALTCGVKVPCGGGGANR